MLLDRVMVPLFCGTNCKHVRKRGKEISDVKPIIRVMFPGLLELYTSAIREIDKAKSDVVMSLFFVSNGYKFPSPENNIRDALVRACERGVHVHLIYSLQICERYMAPLQKVRWSWCNRAYDYEPFHIAHPNFHIHFPFNTEYDTAEDAAEHRYKMNIWETTLMHCSNTIWVKNLVHQKFILIDTKTLFWGEMNIDQYLFDPEEPQFINLSARLQFDDHDMALFRGYVDSVIHSHPTTPDLPKFISGNFGDKNTEVERILRFIESSNEYLWIENQWFHLSYLPLHTNDISNSPMARIAKALVEASNRIPVLICSMGEMEEKGLVARIIEFFTANSKLMLRRNSHNIEFYHQRHTVLHTKFFMNESSVHWTTSNLSDPSLVSGMAHELALFLTHPEDVVKFRNEIWGQHMMVGRRIGRRGVYTFEMVRDHFRTCEEFLNVDLDTLFCHSRGAGVFCM